MLGFKKLIIGIVIGAIGGFWVGINMGKGQPLLSNPFADKETRQLAKEKAADIVDETKDKAANIVNETKEAVKKKLEE